MIRSIGVKILVFVVFALYFGCSSVSKVEKTEDVSESIYVIQPHDLSYLNADNIPGLPTFDLVIFYSTISEITFEQIIKQIKFAKQVFKKQGVQINIVSAQTVELPSDWHYLVEDAFQGHQVEDQPGIDFYQKFDYERSVLSEKAMKVFSTFSKLSNFENPDRTLFLVILKDVKTSWFEKDPKTGEVKLRIVDTSALSFPTYKLGDRVPKSLRGFFAMQTYSDDKTMAHELGHKLINVSHEGFNICPVAEGHEPRSLMLYGKGTEIGHGKKGRWHYERLHLSPYLYKIKDGQKIWNPDFKAGGVYSDPIYGKYMLQPACRK